MDIFGSLMLKINISRLWSTFEACEKNEGSSPRDQLFKDCNEATKLYDVNTSTSQNLTISEFGDCIQKVFPSVATR